MAQRMTLFSSPKEEIRNEEIKKQAIKSARADSPEVPNPKQSPRMFEDMPHRAKQPEAKRAENFGSLPEGGFMRYPDMM